ncbi:restriction endonuclease subunit S [Algoriphagus hitonicola]|uniref:Type I restriction enzyme, S subunit n=1 Tax=Algoriphagus hitonicola TaxID=435880 RepID=A0A1I2UF18_9BACT|nr:restriction endonuclease subunit S [Algoriphagus hitonicola]SFG75774.1 type I restriction enzyme, S subunit [Algoriphagus hitonicola]
MIKGWVLVALGEIAEIISGKNQKEVENPNGEYPIYGSGGVFGFADQYLCPPGTTVIGRKGTINNPIFVNEKFWNVDTAFGIHPCEYVLPKLLFYFCKGFNFKKLDKSTTIPSLAKRDLLQIDFPLIPLPEQRAIVARIEELFSELDHAIANLKSAQAKLEIYRQAVLKKAFDGGFTKEFRLQHSISGFTTKNWTIFLSLFLN